MDEALNREIIFGWVGLGKQQNELHNLAAPTLPVIICHLGIAMEMTSDFSVWRERAMACINATAYPLKDQYSSNYYRPDHSSSPYNAVKLAMEVVTEALCRPDLRDSPDWRSLVFAELDRRREGFLANDIADPDGYVTATLMSFISALHQLDSATPEGEKS